MCQEKLDVLAGVKEQLEQVSQQRDTLESKIKAVETLNTNLNSELLTVQVPHKKDVMICVNCPNGPYPAMHQQSCWPITVVRYVKFQPS